MTGPIKHKIQLVFDDTSVKEARKQLDELNALMDRARSIMDDLAQRDFEIPVNYRFIASSTAESLPDDRNEGTQDAESESGIVPRKTDNQSEDRFSESLQKCLRQALQTLAD